MKIEELNHVALYVRDVDASVKFYRDILELEQLPRPAFDFPGAWFRLGDSQELHLIGDRQEDVNIHRPNHFALRVASAGDAEELIINKGIKYFRNIRPDGAIQFFIQDPDGYYLELFSGP